MRSGRIQYAVVIDRDVLSSANVQPISANPGASNIIPGTGLLGHLIGLDNIPGVRVGGLWIGNADYLFTGGVKPRTWSFNSALFLNLNIDLQKLASIPGASMDAELMQFNGEDSNGKAGVVTAYDGLSGPKPFVRTELYELWWRQTLFADKLIIRAGKTTPTADFNNVTRAVPTSDTSLKVPAVSGLIYTPIFKNPTLIGVSPGYYNTAYGITANFAPTRNFYLTYALYDGALARGIQTGLREGPVFNGHYFTIGEAGYAWTLGEHTIDRNSRRGRMGANRRAVWPGTKSKWRRGLLHFRIAASMEASRRRRQQRRLGLFSVRDQRLAHDDRQRIFRRWIHRIRPDYTPAGGFNRHRTRLVVAESSIRLSQQRGDTCRPTTRCI